jgi:PAS domain S-box
MSSHCGRNVDARALPHWLWNSLCAIAYDKHSGLFNSEVPVGYRRNSGNTFRLVWVRVAVPVIGTVCLFLAAAFFYYLPAVRESLMLQKREAIRDLTQNAWGVLEAHHDMEISGELTGDEARKRAAAVISRMRFGLENKDYFWINDLHPRMIMHPYRPDLDGTDLTHYADCAGTRLFVAFVEASRRTGEGFVQYYWQWKDDPDRVVPKLSFVKRFAPWGWIVGTGVYLDDVEAEAASQAERLVRSGFVVFLLASLLAMVSILQGRQADIRLRRSRDKMRAVFDQSFQFMVLLDTEGRVLEVNATALEPYGLRECDVKGRSFWKTFWWAHSSEARTLLRKAVREAAGGHGVCWQTSHPDGKGAMLDMHFSVKPAVDSEGGIFGLIAEGHDVTEQVRARRERERSMDELEARNVELERVAYVVSHDLRNPLVTIKGFIGVLQEALSRNDIERAELALRRIDLAGDRIGGLLRDLTTLFRLGALDGFNEQVDLGELLREVIVDLDPVLKARGGEVRSVSPLPVVSGDRDRLREVLHNLLENCTLFARSDVPLVVEVGALDDAEGYEIFVRDNGVGIRPAYLDKVFGLFEQLTPNGRGTGVGLTLVRRIVEQHGGRVWAESDGENCGTVIRFTLPRADVEESLDGATGNDPDPADPANREDRKGEDEADA